MITFTALALALASRFADVLAPPACAACDARLDCRAVLCAPCAEAVVAADPDPIVAFAVFGGPIAIALRRLKYDDRPDLARSLGDLLRRAARDAGLCADVVVPVPLHPARLAERGYNQAALLGTAVARELGAPLAVRALSRTRNTSPQAQLDRAHRLENVASAFRVRAPEQVRGRRVVLVDDVATTGTTVGACGDALREAGATSVTALVVARADLRGPTPVGTDSVAVKRAL
jgi:ComF family protein